MCVGSAEKKNPGAGLLPIPAHLYAGDPLFLPKQESLIPSPPVYVYVFFKSGLRIRISYIFYFQIRFNETDPYPAL